MSSTLRFLSRPTVAAFLFYFPLAGCSPDPNPSDASSGGSAGEASSGGRSSGGRNSGSGGQRSSGGETQTQMGGSEAGGAAESGGTSATGGQADGGGGAAAGGTGSGGEASCDGGCRLTWPLHGEVSRDWTVANYVDLDPGAGTLDFQGGGRTYDGHRGIDIAIASLRTMDQGVPVFSAGPGVVTAVHDGEADRNIITDIGACSLVANSVYVTQSDGREARYLHFRKGSIQVEVGQTIATGEKLGEVGSSGCSSTPHLHFELTEAPGSALVDPFEQDFWIDPPAYDAPPRVMEALVVDGTVYSVEDVQVAPPSPTHLQAKAPFSVVVITGGTQVGTVEQVDVVRDDTLAYVLEPYTFEGNERHYMRWWPGIVELSAEFRLDVKLDGDVVETLDFVVE